MSTSPQSTAPDVTRSVSSTFGPEIFVHRFAGRPRLPNREHHLRHSKNNDGAQIDPTKNGKNTLYTPDTFLSTDGGGVQSPSQVAGILPVFIGRLEMWNKDNTIIGLCGTSLGVLETPK